MPCSVAFAPGRVKLQHLGTGKATPDWSQGSCGGTVLHGPWVPPAASASSPGGQGRAGNRAQVLETSTERLSTCYSSFGVKVKQLKWCRPKYEGHHEAVQDGVVFTSLCAK